MRLTYKIVTYKDARHLGLVSSSMVRSFGGDYIITGDGNSYPDGMIPPLVKKRFAVIAMDGQRLVGWLLWEAKFIDRPGCEDFYSHGTWVHKRYRRQRIASRLWARMIKELKPKKMHLVAITDRGLTLAMRLANSYPHIKWDICEDGDRKLRNLRKTA
jgi:GNAT superfamily N-acetyltransferase